MNSRERQKNGVVLFSVQMENTDTIEDEDLDVNEERLKINDYFEQRDKNPNIRERLVALNQARKVYKFGSRDFECRRTRKKVALRNFSLGLEPSEEIFGIVGGLPMAFLIAFAFFLYVSIIISCHDEYDVEGPIITDQYIKLSYVF